tara:strand:+ start:10856 stop:11983 length:1128 start_codon:yes stop_codon:yes gene_type:complete
MSNLQKIIKNYGHNLSKETSEKITKKVSGKDRLVKKSWIILKEELNKEGIKLGTRTLQDITAKLLKERNRNTLVGLENRKNFTIKEWLKQNNITEDFKKFAYISWWNFEAEDRHKSKMNKVNPQEIRPSLNSIKKQIVLGENLNLYNKDFKHPEGIPYYLRNISYSNTNLDVKNVEADDDSIFKFPKELTGEKNSSFGYSLKNIKLSYDHFPLELKHIDGLMLNDRYKIILPKTSDEVLYGGQLARNCMGSPIAMSRYIKQTFILKNVNKYNNYIDAHIVDTKENLLVGILALEKIIRYLNGEIKDEELDNFFIGSENSKDFYMETLCRKFLKENYNIKAPINFKKEKIKKRTKSLLMKTENKGRLLELYNKSFN